jgi:molybdate transport system regulatory protein
VCVSRIRLAVYLGEGEQKLGPGKIHLLAAVRDHGSISAAARSMGMAYRHAWELIDELNRCFATPVVAATTGGKEGGGAKITPWGEELIERFQAMERATGRAVRAELDAIDARLAPRRAARHARASRGRPQR